jgi:hypothetical protein
MATGMDCSGLSLANWIRTDCRQIISASTALAVVLRVRVCQSSLRELFITFRNENSVHVLYGRFPVRFLSHLVPLFHPESLACRNVSTPHSVGLLPVYVTHQKFVWTPPY